MILRAGAAGPFVAMLIAIAAGRANASDEMASDAEAFSGDVIALVNLLEKHHYEPPANQQVVLLAARALYKSRDQSPPADLAVQCSAATGDAEGRSILIEACGPGFEANSKVRSAVAEHLSACVPGGLQLLSMKAGIAQRQLAENRYVGLGIASHANDQREMNIVNVLKGGPMERAGVRIGTVIRTIDGWATKGQGIEDCVERLRGPEGTSVELTIRRPGSEMDEPLTVERGVVPQELLEIEIEDHDGRRIAIVSPRQLGASAPHELRQLAAKEHHLDGLVLDLRNVEGPAHFAVLIADQFLDGGEMGFLCRRDRKTPVRAQEGELFPNVPIAIAAEPSSTGSAGWLATVLMERKRAVVFGQKSNRPNLDFETYALPGGTQTAVFATRVLESPGGARTLVVSETTQATPELLAVDPSANSAGQPGDRIPDTGGAGLVGRLLTGPQVVSPISTRPAVRAVNRGPLVIAKEYLRSLPPRVR